MKKINENGLWSEKIPYIKKLKNFYSGLNYKGINLWPVMANEAYTYYRNQDRDFKERLKLIIRFIFFKDNFEINEDKGKILASYFMPRDDHHELVKKAISAFPKEEIFFLDAYEHKKNPVKKYKISVPNPFRLFSIWLKFKRNNLKKVLGRYYWLFITRTYQRYKQIKYFKKVINKLEPKGYVAFCSPAFGEESILTLICKKRGVPTFSLQHGLIVNYPNFSPVEILNENILADYTLVWGETTYDVQKKYVNSERLIIAGNPKYSQTKMKKAKTNKMKKGLVLFPVTGNDKTRDELIKIVKDVSSKYKSIDFQISVHPFDDLNYYKKNLTGKNIYFIEKGKDIKKIMEKSDFIILHNTTLAMEALTYSIPIFRYNDEAFISMWENDDTFKNSKELEKLIKKAKDSKTLKKWLKTYEKELKRTFYFHPKKSIPEIYYEKIRDFQEQNRKDLNKKYHSVGIIAFKNRSERVPGKNFRKLSGKPLYTYIIDKALNSNLDKVFVITDKKDVKEQVEKLGAEILEVPKWYFGKEVTGDKMLSYPAKKINADIYVQLFATAPFLRTETINKAIEILEGKKYDSVFTVNKKHYWAWFNGKPLTYFPGNLPRSQDATPLIIETTGLYAIKNDVLKEYKRRVGNKPFMLEIDEIEGIDIDNLIDFTMAELLVENMSKIKEITKKEFI